MLRLWSGRPLRQAKARNDAYLAKRVATKDQPAETEARRMPYGRDERTGNAPRPSTATAVVDDVKNGRVMNKTTTKDGDEERQEGEARVAMMAAGDELENANVPSGMGDRHGRQKRREERRKAEEGDGVEEGAGAEEGDVATDVMNGMLTPAATNTNAVMTEPFMDELSDKLMGDLSVAISK
ncbi:hypothetical protein F441_07618 [Phytophthora nicotianae CJ01A1]|nr:hypothetical protein F441_07618 [Phytophthora nicotianae CJ01A1]